MTVELEAISRTAKKHREEFEFFTELENLMREKPDFFRRLEKYLTENVAGSTVPRLSASNGITKIDMIVEILGENGDWMSSKQIMRAAEKKGFTVASGNPRHAFSSALSTEKRKKSRSRIAHRNRKWGLAEWGPSANKNQK